LPRVITPAEREAVLNLRARRVDRDSIARQLKLRGATVTSIIKAARRAGDIRVGRTVSRPSRVPIEVQEELLNARAAGKSLSALSRQLGFPRSTVETLIAAARANGDPRAAKKTTRPIGPKEQAYTRDIPVPAWVERAGLDLEYLSIAETRGEEEAASHCRRLKALRQIPVQTAGYPSGVSPPQNCAPAGHTAGRGGFLRGGE
jgi:hypothetical protein